MRLARSLASGEVRIEEAEDPRAGPGEVVCRVLACGVCASDVTDWHVAGRLPAVLGHEPCGVVAELGEGLSAPAPGTRVVIHHHASCGDCDRCRSGHETLCDQFRASRLDPGGFAERVRVPAQLVGELLALPEGIDPVAGTFVEPLACALRAQRRAAVGDSQSVLVLGAGVGGLLHIAAARAKGVEQVWVSEPRPERLEHAVKLGADPHLGMPVEVAIVCTPEPAALRAAAAALAPGGRLCIYALPAPGRGLALQAGELFWKEITLLTSYSAGAADMREALKLIATGVVQPLPLVSHRLSLADTARALELQRSGRALKAVVLPAARA